MQTAHVAAMLKPRMRPGIFKFVLRASAVFHSVYVCSNVNMSLSRCLWSIIIIGVGDNNSNRKVMYTSHFSWKLPLSECGTTDTETSWQREWVISVLIFLPVSNLSMAGEVQSVGALCCGQVSNVELCECCANTSAV